MNAIRRLASLDAKSRLLVIGLMSGMSADGVDLALASIEGSFPDLRIELLGSAYRPYSQEIRNRIQATQSGTTCDVSRLNFQVAREFSACVLDFLHHQKRAASEIDLIGSHGQTLFHSTDVNDETPSSLQVGSPSIIAELTGIPTVGNFRPRDIATGGQGAPLVCLADFILYRDQGLLILNNLGSISNLTVVNQTLEEMVAFDTGPANMAIDFFAKQIPNNSFGIDRDGSYSARGKIHQDLLAEMLNSPFFLKSPPKAAGYREFGPSRLRELQAKHCKTELVDLVRTSVEFAAVTLNDAYRKFVFPKFPGISRAIFSGGGIHNPTLMKRIRELLPELSIEVFQNEFADAKEALCFAILAHQTIKGHPGNVPAATGASKPVVLGEIAF